MITGIEGKPGSGKSFYCVVRIIQLLRKGMQVVTNIELNVEALKKYVLENYGYKCGEDQIVILSREESIDFQKYTPEGEQGRNVTVVLDEAGRYFNARDWNRTSRGLLDYLALHRHYHTDIVMIDQDLNNVDKQFRRLMSEIYRVRDWQNNSPLPFPWPLPQFRIYQIDYDGKTTIDSWFIKKDKKIYALYNSYSKRIMDMRTAQKAVDLGQQVAVGGKAKMRAMIIITLVLLVCGGFFLVKRGGFKTGVSGPVCDVDRGSLLGPVLSRSVTNSLELSGSVTNSPDPAVRDPRKWQNPDVEYIVGFLASRRVKVALSSSGTIYQQDKNALIVRDSGVLTRAGIFIPFRP